MKLGLLLLLMLILVMPLLSRLQVVNPIGYAKDRLKMLFELKSMGKALELFLPICLMGWAMMFAVVLLLLSCS